MWSLIVASLLVSFTFAGPIDVVKPKDPVANATTTTPTTPVVNVTTINATTLGVPEATTIANIAPPNRNNGTDPPPTTTPKPTSTTTTESPKPTTPTTTTTVVPSTTTPTTSKPETTTGAPVKPTTAPTPAPNHDRKFDGPSFIGGIILACGFTAIGFIAFKFYKARTEHNYHTFSTT